MYSMGFHPRGGTAFIEINARPVINSTTELAEWDAFVAIHKWQGGAALHVDTGMNRLGMSVAEAMALAPRVQTENHGITLLMSHLACAEIPDHPLNAKQIRQFREVSTLYHGVPASLANSSGIYLGHTAHCDMVRPGAAIYGINPTPGRVNLMQDVVELTGRILQMRSVERGETIGYGATWTAKRASRIAVVALGYADGLLRAASGTDRDPGGVAIVAGETLPIRRPHFDGLDLRRYHRSSRRRRPQRRRRDFDRSRDHDRGRRRGRRHHRLRDPHPPRRTVRTHLSW